MKQSSFLWVSADLAGILHKSHLGCAAQVLTSFQPGFLSTLFSPTVCFLPHQAFVEQAEHGVTRCLHISLTPPLVATAQSAGLLVAELSVMSKINGSSFCTHCWTAPRCFAFSTKFLQSVTCSLSLVLLTLPVVPAWIDPTSVFFA